MKRISVNLDQSLRQCTINPTLLPTLPYNLLETLGLEPLTSLQNDIVWDYQIGKSPLNPAITRVAPLVHAYLGKQVSDALRDQHRHLDPVVRLALDERSMDFVVLLHLDAFKAPKEIPFTENRGLLTALASLKPTPRDADETFYLEDNHPEDYEHIGDYVLYTATEVEPPFYHAYYHNVKDAMPTRVELGLGQIAEGEEPARKTITVCRDGCTMREYAANVLE